jgi:hypothetical protein
MHTKWLWNHLNVRKIGVPNDNKIYQHIPAQAPKLYQIRDFWYANLPSGNREAQVLSSWNEHMYNQFVSNRHMAPHHSQHIDVRFTYLFMTRRQLGAFFRTLWPIQGDQIGRRFASWGILCFGLY